MYEKKTNRQRNQNKFYNTLLGCYDTIPSTKELILRIKGIDNLKVKALACVLYLTGARKEEIMKEFKPCQIRESRRTDGLVFVHFVNLPVQKKRGDMYQDLRSIPVMKEFYMEYLKLIYAYIRAEHIRDDEPLFKEGGRWAGYKIKDCLGLNPHRLRHIRATNLGREEGFNATMLRRFFNWSVQTNIGSYEHYNSRDLENQAVANLSPQETKG